jgi:hypothetical protein
MYVIPKNNMKKKKKKKRVKGILIKVIKKLISFTIIFTLSHIFKNEAPIKI